MAGSRAVSAYQWDMPRSLAGVVGPETAQEIRWMH